MLCHNIFSQKFSMMYLYSIILLHILSIIFYGFLIGSSIFNYFLFFPIFHHLFSSLCPHYLISIVLFFLFLVYSTLPYFIGESLSGEGLWSGVHRTKFAG